MKVLVVDDRPENRLILQTKLRAAGFAVELAPHGADALRLLRTAPTDIVVTDLMMPQMDGYQLTHAIKTEPALKEIPVLVYTATYTDPKDEALALNLGADAFLRKPATDEEFFSALNEVLARARRGELQARTPAGEEVQHLRDYSERLIHKLEDKVTELEAADRKLRELNSTLEARVQQATAELRQANEDIAAFAYSVSHDLRAPLRVIEGFLSAVRTDDPPLDDAERKRLLRRAEAIAAETQVFIGELLEYAQLQSGDLHLEPVRLSDAVRIALGRIEPDRRAGARVEVGPLASRVLAHEATLVQVLQNLLANALKFTKPGAAACVAVFEEHHGHRVRCAIRDEGIGIPAEHRERIFKVFERLHGKSVYPGSGIGLAIVHRAITKMGGSVGVDSIEGAGSTFWIELPAA